MNAYSVRSRPDAVRRQLAGLALLASLAFAAEVAGQETGGDAPENRLARALVDSIPTGKRIALYPLWGDSQDVPEDDAKPIYRRLIEAIYRTSEGRHEVLGRDQSDAIWEAWQQEREDSDYQTLWERRRVGVVVRCQDRPDDRDLGIHLSCAAVSVGTESDESDVYASAVFPVSRPAFRFDYALNRLGRRLAEDLFKQLGGAQPGRIEGAYIIHRGERSRLSGILEGHLSEGVTRRIDEHRKRLEREAHVKDVLQSKEEVSADESTYRLCGGIQSWGESTMRLDVRLTRSVCGSSAASGKNEVLSTRTVDLEWKWLPPGVKEDSGAKRFRAEVRAELSGKLDKEGARRTMRNLARARVVAEALGVAPPSTDVARAEAGIRALTGILAHGIPVDERVDFWPDGSGGLKTELTARVVKIGTAVRPGFRASLENSELRKGQAIRIHLEADEAVRAAVFAWGADDKIVRLYPNPGVPAPKLDPESRMVLPRDGEGRIWSAPMPGNTEDHEAIIVLAAGERLDFERLSSLVGNTPEETSQIGVPAASFFNALAKLDTSRLTLTVLPYLVTR